jgi:hypothetical protein
MGRLALFRTRWFFREPLHPVTALEDDITLPYLLEKLNFEAAVFPGIILRTTIENMPNGVIKEQIHCWYWN